MTKLELSQQIKQLYEYDFFRCGGYAHIVTDDSNVDDGCIIYCIKECYASKEQPEGTRLCIEILQELLNYSEQEREEIIDLFWNNR